MTKDRSVLLKIEDLRIEGYSDEKWIEIVHGVDLTLHRGEVLGLIGESGAGKSTIGAAAMGYARDGTRISGGTIGSAEASRIVEQYKAQIGEDRYETLLDILTELSAQE